MLLQHTHNLSTPSVVIDWDKCLLNILDMAGFARERGLKLRPHIKAHKLPALALEQIKHGAIGVTASKLSEAEVMIEAGISDILLAYPVVGRDKLEYFLKLACRCRFSTIVDNYEAACMLSEAACAKGMKIDVYIKVDTGLHRLGVKPGQPVVDLARQIIKLKGIRLRGLLTHAGHVYAARSRAEVERIGNDEGRLLVESQFLLKQSGITVEEVSVGSTPTVKIAGLVKGVTEIRPGNYVFYDAIQVGLGVVTPERCALRVIASVIGRPAPDRVVIDAGSKVLALDKGAHGTSIVNGFGMIVGHPDAVIERLSEEHGIVKWSADKPLNLGDRLEIIPNHACTAINLTDEVYLVTKDQPPKAVAVAARGKVK